MDVKGSTVITDGFAPGALNVFDRNNITPDILQSKVNEYFTSGAEIRYEYIKNRDNTVNKEVRYIYTFTGLILFLGFVSRATYFEWENKKSIYSDILKKARLRIEQNYESMLQTNNPVGAIFALKNQGWTDQVTVDNRSSDGSMTPAPTIVNHSKDQDKEANKVLRKLFTGKNEVNKDAITSS
jgi:hypothetical protein